MSHRCLSSEFDEIIHDALSCPICFADRMVDAMVVCPCGHTLCGHCANRCKAHDAECPLCRVEVHTLLPVYALREVIEADRLNPFVKCKLCDWSGKKDNFVGHIRVGDCNDTEAADTDGDDDVDLLRRQLSERLRSLQGNIPEEMFHSIISKTIARYGVAADESTLVNSIVDQLLSDQDFMGEPTTAEDWLRCARAATTETFQVAGQSHTKRSCCLAALAIDPNKSIAWHMLGNSLKDNRETVIFKGQAYTRRTCCLQALRHDSANGKAWNNIITTTAPGETISINGSIYSQTDCAARALLCDPGNAVFWSNLGHMLKPKAGQQSVAADKPPPTVKVGRREFTRQAAYVMSLIRDDRRASAWIDVASTLSRSPDGDEAAAATVDINGQTLNKLDCYKRALTVDPKCSKAWNNISVLLGTSGQIELHEQHHDHLTCLVQAVTHGGKASTFWANLGAALSLAQRAQQEQWERLPQGTPPINGPPVTVVIDSRDVSAVDCFVEALKYDPFKSSLWQRLSESLKADQTVVAAGKSHNKQSCKNASHLYAAAEANSAAVRR